MKAGREMDIAVMEKMMGWSRVSGMAQFIGGPSECWQAYPGGSTDTPIPYSRDISAAWEVVERLRSQDWEVSVKAFKARGALRPDLCYSCVIARRDQFCALAPAATAYGVTAPEAICRAALQIAE